MKKITKILLTVCLLAGILSCYNLFEHEHVHIHAVGPGDSYGTCPGCGRSLTVDFIESQPTCTSSGVAIASCYNSECSGAENVPVPIPALGHDYQLNYSKAATCTDAGYNTYSCSRCGDSYTNSVAALGHDYAVVTNKKATCTEDGLQTYTCNRCGNAYKKTVKALGHDFKYEEKEATCTEDGYKNGVCSRCGEEDNTVYPALGHDLGEWTIVKDATCTEDGLKESVCSRCNETIQEKIDMLGHDYPDEWIVEKEPSYFAEGLRYKLCKRCGERLEEAIPKKDITPIAVGGGIAVAALGILAFVFRKLRILKNPKKVKTIKKFKPKFQDKTIVVCSDDYDLVEKLREKSYLQVKVCPFNELKEKVVEAEPDLALITVNSKKELDEIIGYKEEEWKDFDLALLVKDSILNRNRNTLDELEKNEKINGYLSTEESPYNVLVKLILPIMNTEINSDEGLANIGGVADLLGIPGVSKVLDLYVNGRDIKATLEEEELGVTETATIISDIAYILGLDTVGDVANLVNDVNKIKKAANKNAGAYEGKKGYKAAKEIVDVVSDVIDK